MDELLPLTLQGVFGTSFNFPPQRISIMGKFIGNNHFYEAKNTLLFPCRRSCSFMIQDCGRGSDNLDVLAKKSIKSARGLIAN